MLRRLFYKIFPTYRRLELKFVSWDEGDKLIRNNEWAKNETEEWHIAKEEDTNHCFGMVYLERKERII